jgi:osmotically inducible lipoprotein OsmB
MIRSKLLFGVVAASALALAGCGTNPGERAVTGGLLGAGAGAAIGAAAGNPAAGALIGGAVGAVGGAATSPCDVDLNAPGGRRDCR